MSWYLCPMELRILGSSSPAAGFTSTSPFMILYILQTFFFTFSWTAGLPAGVEPPEQRHLRGGWSHEGCNGLTVAVSPPMWISNVAEGCPTPQMRTLELAAQGLCSNVSGQQLGILQVSACKGAHSVGFCSSDLDVFPLERILSQL